MYAPAPPPVANRLQSWEEKFIREKTGQPKTAVFCPKVSQYVDTDRKLYVIQRGGICGEGRLHPKRPVLVTMIERKIKFVKCRDPLCK